MNYQDFIIQFGSQNGEGYPVTVSSPAGEGRGLFIPPFDPEAMAATLRELGRRGEVPVTVGDQTLPQFRHLIPAGVEETTRLTPREIGKTLFDALFQGDVSQCYEQCMGGLQGKPGAGLRIIIRINPAHEDMDRLFSFPWEYLFKHSIGDFLNLSRTTPVMRFLDVPRPPKPASLPERLRILVAIANPPGLRALNLDQERAKLEKIWCQFEGVELVYLERADLFSLRQKLLQEPFHILHYMGHGDYDRKRGQGVLFFHGREGGVQPVSGLSLATHLKDFKSLRLVFLNACETAVDGYDNRLNPFTGVAAALIQGGFPAVLAMQSPVSDRAAINFSENVYRRLAAGDPLDSAVVEGRLAVHCYDERSTEWGTPVLFSRVPSMKLFDPTRRPESSGGVNWFRISFFVAFLVLMGWLSSSWFTQGEHVNLSADKSVGIFDWFNQTRSPKSSEDLEESRKDHMDLKDMAESLTPVTISRRPGEILEVPIRKGLVLRMVWIPPNTFQMGSPENEPGRDVRSETLHEREISKGFWMSQTEVSQALWSAVKLDNPSGFKGDDLPVERVTYQDVVSFVNNLNLMTERTFSLPTEAQWEYACRAGSKGPYNGPLNKVAWYDGNSGEKSHPIGSLEPNAWGLYNMHGNVWEWCRDSWSQEPGGRKDGRYKLVRGGSWKDSAAQCRSARRLGIFQKNRTDYIGFRLVLERQ